MNLRVHGNTCTFAEYVVNDDPGIRENHMSTSNFCAFLPTICWILFVCYLDSHAHLPCLTIAPFFPNSDYIESQGSKKQVFVHHIHGLLKSVPVSLTVILCRLRTRCPKRAPDFCPGCGRHDLLLQSPGNAMRRPLDSAANQFKVQILPVCSIVHCCNSSQRRGWLRSLLKFYPWLLQAGRLHWRVLLVSLSRLNQNYLL